jgi:amidophosphoribosyltransferase
MTALPSGNAPLHRDPDDDTLRLECGVCGVWGAPEDEASSIVALGLHALQHRGQEACGIASVKSEMFHTERQRGLVGDVFGGADLSTRMPGDAAVGHTRYSTAGGSSDRNIQPMYADLDSGGIAIAHNGNLTNFLFLQEPAGQRGFDLPVDLGFRSHPASDRAQP